MIKRVFAAGIVALLVFSSIVAALQVSVRKAEPNQLKATEEILQGVSKIRQLPVKHPVKNGAKNRDEIQAAIIRDLDENTTPEELDASFKTLKKLGLAPADFQLRDFTIGLLTEQVAGFYDPKTQFFYLASWIPIAEQKTVIAHELAHALQDQHFNLKRFDKWAKDDSDAELAAHSIAEGEATIVMFLYDFAQLGFKIDVTQLPPLAESMQAMNGISNDKQFPMLAKAPNIIREGLQFPYFYGAGFVQEVLKHGSWERLDKAWQTLPTSSEQIMHPEKYLAGERPVRIDLLNYTAMLGQEWKQLETDINGEFGYQLTLAEFINKETAQKAAAGWGGDKYATYEDSKSGDLMVVQFTAWDSLQDSDEFFKAYAERTENRFKVKSSAEATAKIRLYETGEGLIAIEKRDKDVVIIEGAKSREQLARLQAELWKSKKALRQ